MIASAITDKFFLAAQARPSTADHYQAWLESYLDHGGTVDSFSTDNFRVGRLHTITHDAELPPGLCGSASVDLIVPSGVTLTVPDRGHCVIFDIESGTLDGIGRSTVYKDILASMVERGYSLEQLVPQKDWDGFLGKVLEATIGVMRKSTVADVDAILKAVSNLDLGGEAKRALGLDPALTLPAPMQQSADDFKEGLAEMWKGYRYRLDPSSQTPMPSLLKPKVKPADAAAAAKQAEEAAMNGTTDRMTVMSPIRLKNG